jgi:hypothetical protein
MLKFCPGCSKDKPLTDFASRSDTVDQLQGWCKTCTNLASKSWYKRNGLKKREAQCDYYAQHADEINKRRREKRAAAKREVWMTGFAEFGQRQKEKTD